MLHVWSIRYVRDDRNVRNNEPHEHEHDRNEHVRIGRSGPENRNAVPHDPAKEKEGAIHPGSGLRIGEKIQAAEIPVSPRERTPGQHDQPDPHTSQDLVPEPQVQEQACPEGQGKVGPTVREPTQPQEGRSACLSQRRQAMHRVQ